jgi:integrase
MPGEGSVYKTGGRWVAQLSIGPRGSRQLLRRYAPWHDNTKARARLLLKELLAERRADDPRMTLGEYLPRWLDDYVRRDRVGVSQGRNASAIVRLHLLPALRDTRLSDLRPSHVERLVSGVRGSASTRRHVYNVLAVAIGDAARDGLVESNVVRLVGRPTGSRTDKRPWTLEELGRVLDAARGDRFEALYVIAAATGLRQGELLGLAWQDVDLDAGTAHVGLQLQRVGGKYIRTPRKGQGRSYDVDLPPIAVEHLRGLLARRTVVPVDGGLVFVTDKGRPVNGSVVTHHLRTIAEKAGVPYRDFHGLRRFQASLGPTLGIDARVTQDRLGHANIATTLGIYTYTDRSQARDAALRVDGAIRKAIASR